MRRIVMSGVILSASVALAGEGDRAFDAIESRPLWERPSDGLTLQQKTEAALDRGNGRVEDETLFQLRVMERDRLLRLGEIERSSEYERYREEINRGEQLEQMRIRAAQAAQQAKTYERESEALAKQRAAWRTIVERENAAGGAVVDQMALQRVEAEYRASVTSAEKARDEALKSAGGDREKIGAAVRAFEASKAEAMQRRLDQKGVILGYKR
jgi:hypothetical protein